MAINPFRGPRPPDSVPHLAGSLGPARPNHGRLAATLAYGLPAAALAAAGAGLYRRLHRSVPPIDGTLACPVTAPVRVVRDHWGIPHIYAENAADLFTAQGYVQAQDRLWSRLATKSLYFPGGDARPIDDLLIDPQTGDVKAWVVPMNADPLSATDLRAIPADTISIDEGRVSTSLSLDKAAGPRYRTAYP